MNIFTLLEKLRETRRQFRLTAIEQALYYELVVTCNKAKWPKQFCCSNAELCRTVNISESTLIRARNTLIAVKLVNYCSGKSKRHQGSYSLTTSETTSGTTCTEADNIKHKTKTPSKVSHESESELKPKSIIIPFTEVKNQLLADEAWKQLIAMRSGISIKLLDILPAQIDEFLQYIAVTGQEHTILTLSDAKRRFFWWWTNQGKKAYEEQENNPDTVIY